MAKSQRREKRSPWLAVPFIRLKRVSFAIDIRPVTARYMHAKEIAAYEEESATP